jgi:predicted nucleotidyltransferase
MITLADISSALTRVLPRYDVREAYLFGSFARGEQTPDSDIDLRLACGDSMTFGALYQLSLDLEDELGRKIDIVTNPSQHMHPTFRKNIKKDEERLYEAVR